MNNEFTIKIKEGQVYNYHTSDAFDPITGVEFNKHTETILIVDVNKDKVKLYNFDTGKFNTCKLLFFKSCIRSGIYELTNEFA
jgi:hypothetical protein